MDGAGRLQETLVLQRQLDEREADSQVAFAFFCLIMGDRLRPGPTTAATIMTLSLLMLFSGGVVGGLGNFLILPVAFGGIPGGEGYSRIAESRG